MQHGLSPHRAGQSWDACKPRVPTLRACKKGWGNVQPRCWDGNLLRSHTKATSTSGESKPIFTNTRYLRYGGQSYRKCQERSFKDAQRCSVKTSVPISGILVPFWHFFINKAEKVPFKNNSSRPGMPQMAMGK